MTYPELLQALHARRPVPLAVIRTTLGAAGKSAGDLVDQVFGERSKPASGDPCPRCTGRFKVLNTRHVGNSTVRYLGCGCCGFRPPGNVRATAVAKCSSQPATGAAH